MTKLPYELATLLSDQEEYQKALIYYKQIDTLSPEFEGYEYGYALALQAENDREKALEIAKQGINLFVVDQGFLEFFFGQTIGSLIRKQSGHQTQSPELSLRKEQLLQTYQDWHRQNQIR